MASSCPCIITLSMTRALDVGCGPGDNMGWTAAFDEVVGIDIDSEVLHAARQRYPGATFLQSTGESIPFPECWFDAIHAHVSIPYMDIPAAISEFHRVLRPGGEIFLSLHSFRLVVGFWWNNIRHGNWKGALFLPSLHSCQWYAAPFWRQPN